MVAVAAGVLALVVWGANRPEDPQLAPAAAPDSGTTGDASGTGARSPLPGFDEVPFRIEVAGAEASTWCALLAEDLSQRQQGLTAQRDLRGYDGMVFRFAEPAAVRFTMRDTLIPLSIAFFDAEGRFVSATDMEPCPEGTDNCPTYAAEAPFLHAIEVPQGDLPSLGIAEGARLTFPDGDCPD